MRTLIICCAAATLAVAACQRPAEETADAPMAEADEAAMAPADTGAGGSAGPARRAAGASSAPAATDAAVDTAATAPTESSGEGVRANTPVDQETRDGAKERAEETNLHPRN